MLAYHLLNTVSEDLFCRRRARELFEEGKAVQLKGDVDGALELYTRSIKVQPSAEALTHRAWAYRAKNRVEDAIAECKRAIELDPEYGNPYNDIGSYLLSQGK